MKKTAIVAALTLGLAVIGASLGWHSSATAQQKLSLADMSANSAQWVMPAGDYANLRHSALNDITTDNAKGLKIAWQMSTNATRGHEGQPLVVGNTMYFESAYPNHVFAINLDDYHIKWEFTPTQDAFAVSVACCDLVNRGVAFGDGLVIANALDGKIYALNADTGKIAWKANNADPELGQTVTSAPFVVAEKNRVIVGVSGGEYGVRGYVTAFDLHSGAKVWRAYSEGPDSDTLMGSEFTGQHNAGTSTWHGEQWKIGGGTTWGWYSYDPKLDLFYYGSGNPGTWDPSARPGDNKWSMTVFARHPGNGHAVWAYQMTPHDQWDYDGVNEMILADIKIHDQQVPALVHFDRNGFAFEIDRRNGKLMLAEKYDPSVNWATGFNLSNGRPNENVAMATREGKNTKGICPASIGAKDQQPASFDPQTGYFIVPTNHWCEDYQPFASKYKAGFPYVGATVKMYRGPGDYGGALIAWDPNSGKIVWSDHEHFPAWGGVATTDGGVAFYGTMDGWFKAVNTKTGELLFSQKMPSGIIANPIVFSHGGKEFVATMSGVGGWAGIGLAAGLTNPTAGLGAVGAAADLGKYTTLGGDLTVFSL
jgi:PQQ-dependent dehydrogenase (methanol/ethanol family)